MTNTTKPGLKDWQKLDREHAERTLRIMLQIVGLPVTSAYDAAQVCRLLSISERTFKRLVSIWEPDYIEDRDPVGLESSTLKNQRRVTFPALITWLVDNSTYKREIES